MLVGLKVIEDIAVVEDGVKLEIVPSDGDVFGHGSAVSGIIKALAPEAEIGSIRVIERNKSSRTAIIQLGAQEALSRGDHILNFSFVCAVEAQDIAYKAWVD